MTELVALVILLAFAALTAASEISIVAVSRFRLRRLASGGSKTAKIILKILEMPERFFGTVLVANNVVGALIAALITVMVIRLIGQESRWGVIISTVVAAFCIIISEVTAKTFAARHSERMSMLLAKPTRVLIIVCAPLVRIFEIITKVMVDMLGGTADSKQSLITEEEIRSAIKVGEEEGTLHKDKFKMLSRVFDFSEAIVKNVMTPAKEIVSIDIAADIDDIISRVLEAGYSRIPVYQGSQGNIVGIVNMKDLLTLSHDKGLFVLQDIIYPATFVLPSKKVTELLREFQKGHTHLAIVSDGKHRVEGIITLEDLLEEIVGEIQDEHDLRASGENKNGKKI